MCESRAVIINVNSRMLNIGAQYMGLLEHLHEIHSISTISVFVEYALNFEEIAEGNSFSLLYRLRS